MTAYRNTARLTGTLFLVAMVSSLAGMSMVDAALGQRVDLTFVAAHIPLLHAGLVLEFINSISVVGLGCLWYSVLKRHSEPLAAGYLGLRLLETMACIAASLAPLVLLRLGQPEAGLPMGPALHSTVVAILAVRKVSMELLIPVFFSLSALLLYLSVVQTKILPRFISLWGILAALLVLTANLFKVDKLFQGLMVLPIILNEVFLGVWLIVKGFDREAMARLNEN